MILTIPVLHLVFGNDYDYNYVPGSGGESIYSGKFAGINHLAWCEICYIMEMLDANNEITLQPFI
jgi:hypothetical protein